MANPSRQLRRAAERNRAKSSKAAPVIRPQSVHGFEVDKVGSSVIATFHIGYATFTVDYGTVDAQRIGELFIEAASRETNEGRVEEIRGGSGLVIAHTLPETRS